MVRIAGTSGTAVQVSPSSLEFSTRNWNQAQTVTVTAKVDTDTVDDTVTLTHTATGGGYASVLIRSVTVTVLDVHEDLTARFTDLPESHNAKPLFKFRLEFNLEVETTSASMAVDVLDVTGGRVIRVARVDPPSNRRWRIEIAPDSRDDVVIVLPANRPCTETGAICTSDGLALSTRLEQTVAGLPPPPGFSVEPMSLEVVDGGGYGVDRYYVVLDGRPDSAVTITVSGTDGTGVSVSPSRLRFYNTNWSRRQWVTVSTRADNDAMDETVTLTHSATGFGYDSVKVPDVTVTVRETNLAYPVGAIRLVDGTVESEGRVEIYHVTEDGEEGAWGTVCDDYWNLNDAHTACRQLGYSGATAYHEFAHFGEGTGLIWLDNLRCSGNEERLVDCRRQDNPDVGEHNCTHPEDAGVTCDTTTTMSQRSPLGVGVSVADARAEEGTDETLDFVVSLGRAASETVTVAYATADGSATAGADYTATNGTLTFTPGETEKTVAVPVLDDAHDEGEETLTFRLSAASGAVLADGEATGTIENADPLQRAWLARFGRTVATHVTDAVGDRLRGTPGQDSHLTVGGYRLPLGQPDADGAEPATQADSLASLMTGLAGVLGLGSGQAGGTGVDPGGGGLGWDAWPDAGRDPRLGQSQSVNLNLRRLLLGSSFRLALGGDDGGSSRLRLTAWGRVAGTTFDGQDGILSLDGDVLTGTVGVDGEWDRLLAGLAVAHSRGDGSYTMTDMEANGRGDLENTLTSVHPYLRYAVNDRLDVWGVLGYGTGQMEMEVGPDETLATDTDLAMGAFGGRGILLPAGETGGFELATRTDAMLTRTTSEAVAGMESAEADAHRLRLVLEGSRGFAWAEGRSLTPTMEVGLRHDWGDAETGFGLELGGRVQYADPSLGLTIEGTVRGLLAHEDSDYEEWGASGSHASRPGGWWPGPVPDPGAHLGRGLQWRGRPVDPADHGGLGAEHAARAGWPGDRAARLWAVGAVARGAGDAVHRGGIHGRRPVAVSRRPHVRSLGHVGGRAARGTGGRAP